MHRRRLLCVALFVMGCAVLAATADGTAQQAPASEDTPLLLGVVRGDGVMLPVAVRQEGQWMQARVYDPTPPRRLMRIRDRDGIPRSPWTLHAPGEPSQPLALADLLTVGAHCLTQEGFATEARPEPGAVAAPHLTWAVATSALVAAATLEDARSDPDEDARRVRSFIISLTNAVEIERSAVPRSRLAPVTAAERARVAPEVTILLRDRQRPDQHVYYFEAQKSYQGVVAHAAGWIASSSFRLSIVEMSAGIDAGGESRRPLTRVLGVLRVGADSVWIVERQHYEGTTYDVVSTGIAPQFLRASGGGC